jgi:hypothetical protein
MVCKQIIQYNEKALILSELGSNNDAKIMKAILSKLPPDSDYFKEGDHCIMDRGFRDVIRKLENLDLVTHMPELLDRKTKQKQFTTAEGNNSRRVTLVRWLIEAVNGRIKRKFKIFRDTVPGGYLDKVGRFFNIACAIINHFSPPLSQDSPRLDRIATKAMELMDSENLMQARVETERLDRNTKTWKKASVDECPDFPVLSKEDLETLTLGVYQIRLAKRYTNLHLDDEGEFVIRLNDDFEGVVRAKLESRFAQDKIHNLWISYDGMDGVEGITGYYCRCKQGARTVGCCSHVCAVLWFMGYQRHQDNPEIKVRRRTLNIRDAGEEIKISQAGRAMEVEEEDNEEGEENDEEDSEED